MARRHSYIELIMSLDLSRCFSFFYLFGFCMLAVGVIVVVSASVTVQHPCAGH